MTISIPVKKWVRMNQGSELKLLSVRIEDLVGKGETVAQAYARVVRAAQELYRATTPQPTE